MSGTKSVSIRGRHTYTAEEFGKVFGNLGLNDTITIDTTGDVPVTVTYHNEAVELAEAVDADEAPLDVPNEDLPSE